MLYGIIFLGINAGAKIRSVLLLAIAVYPLFLKCGKGEK